MGILLESVSSGGGSSSDAIYFDPYNGTTLANGADGTPSNPINNEADVLTQLAVKKLSKVVIVSSNNGQGNVFFRLPSNVFGITFIGTSRDFCYFAFQNGNTAAYCAFYNLAISGTNTGNPDDFYNCVIVNFNSTASYNFYNCQIQGIGYSGYDLQSSFFHNCEFVNVAVFCTGDMTIIGGKGILTLYDYPAGVSVITGNALVLTIDASCVGGTITVNGDVTVTNNGTSPFTLTDNSLEALIKAIGS